MAKPVDNLLLDKWRAMDACVALEALADHAKRDPSFSERTSVGTTRWHASVGNYDFELLCNGPKFFDTRAGHGGGGAVDLAMHLLRLPFKQAVRCLRDRGL